MQFRLPFSIALMKKCFLPAICLPVLMTQAVLAQNSIQLFGPVDVRLSTNGTGWYPSDGNNFNTTNLNLTCPASPTATLSSTADGTGNVMVDNFLNVTVTSNGVASGPTNVCPGGGTQSCFTAAYQVPSSTGGLTGVNPDTFVSTGGVLPIDISQLLVAGPVQVQIALEDVGFGAGFFLASSTLYLDTNCTQGGVTGPALVSGNPIPSSGPTTQQLAQDFDFNSGNSQQIGFVYDLTTAQTVGSLAINDGTIPQVNDTPIDPTTFQSLFLAGTSYSTGNCVIHSGELTPAGAPACKLFTLQCTVGAGATATGAQCPVSTINNEIFQDVFDGPGFTLSDIPTPSGPTFHEGIGLLMANDTWPGGACVFDAEADLGSLNCPQNLLTSFSSMTAPAPSAMSKAHALVLSKTEPALSIHSNAVTLPKVPATTISTGSTTRPNSTFITVAGIPEDLTTVTVAGKSAGGWNNNSTVNFTLSSQPPNLVGSLVPGAAVFIPSPIQSITYGISPANAVPAAGAPVANDVTLTNSTGCPTPPNLTAPAASVFTPGQQSFTGLSDGQYLVHYYAQDCAGTEELQFVQDSNGNWSTNFYTYPINVDTTAPVVATGPTLLQAPSAQGTYTVGENVYASFSCTDSLSGVVQCGSNTYAVGATNNTGTLTSLVDTSSPGTKTFTVTAVDAAGNTASASVSYQVVSQYDNQVQFTITPATVTYPQGANVVVQIVPGATSNVALREVGKSVKPQTASSGYTPITGTVQIFDGSKQLVKLYLQGNGAAYYYLSGLSAGKHSLSATYSGDATIPGGTSAPVTFTVQPAPVTLSMACWNTNFPYGADYICGAYTSSNAGPAQGVITYSYDGGAPVTVPLVFGVGIFNIAKPIVGAHHVVVSYAAQGNFAAAKPQTELFTVTPAPVVVAFSPSTWNLTGGNLTLSASVQSWSAGPPKSTGSVTFTNGSTVLGVVPVNASGQASITIAASKIANGAQHFTASYAGGTNYGTGSTSIVVTVAHK
jgi:hypothetical protein